MKYVNVAVDNNSDNTDRLYTYGCEFDNVKIGQKIFVPFNRGNKVKAAYVFETMDHLAKEVKGLKYVESVDQEIYLNSEMIETCVWMKQRYLCRYIEAINCFTPAGTKSKRGKERNPHKETIGEEMTITSLTDEQKGALSRIFSAFGKGKQQIFLLHGVTSSGKTEVYMQTIARAIAGHQNAIMLVPEISLTKQIIERFIGRFGAENIAVLHSKLSLDERYNKNRLPKVEVVDMREELKNGNTSILSRRLYQEMKEILEEGKQIILFLNRRGYSTFVSCRECGYVMKCPECGISMTYHKDKGEVLCHYCGYKKELPKKCPNCQGKYIKHFGTGTEKVEEYVQEIFSEYPVARLDFDTMKQKGSLNKILNDFRKNKTKILVGTQVVAKGLDFHNVGLVGIIAADVALNIPDFKSAERTFQLITQAAGRTGRGDSEGKVVIQTYNPEHYAIIHGANQDYEGFYQMEKAIRNGLGYPPYVDIVQIIINNKNEKEGLEVAGSIYDRLVESLGRKNSYTIFKPHQAIINKHGNLFRYHIIIKAKRGSRKEYINELEKIKKDYTIGIDINPYSLM